MPESPRSAANFTPIAIVGRACLLPGASSPAELAELVFARREAITAVGRDRWGMARERVMTSPSQPAADRAWSDRGGYVTESVESPADLGVSKAELDRLDPLVRWLCVVGQRALREAPPPLRAPFKTSPDGHRTAPLSRGPGSVPPPPLAPVLVVMSGPQVGERIRVSSDFGALRDAEKSYGNVHSPEHLNTEAPTVDCGRVADRRLYRFAATRHSEVVYLPSKTASLDPHWHVGRKLLRGSQPAMRPTSSSRSYGSPLEGN